MAERGVTIPVPLDVYGMAKERYGVMFLARLFVIDKYQKTILVSLSGILIQVSIRHTYNFSLFKKVIHLKVR